MAIRLLVPYLLYLFSDTHIHFELMYKKLGNVGYIPHYDHHYTHVDTHHYSDFRTPGVGDTQDEQHGTVAAGPAEPAGSEGAGDRRWKCDS